MKIPDLRPDAEITLEHCYVLLSKFEDTFAILEGQNSSFKGLAEELNPKLLLEFYEYQFDADAFSRLFQSELGKGVLVGAYAQELMSQVTQEDLDELGL